MAVSRKKKSKDRKQSVRQRARAASPSAAASSSNKGKAWLKAPHGSDRATRSSSRSTSSAPSSSADRASSIAGQEADSSKDQSTPATTAADAAPAFQQSRAGRVGTVFDAVAGRVTKYGLVYQQNALDSGKSSMTQHARAPSLTAFEVLANRKHVRGSMRGYADDETPAFSAQGRVRQINRAYREEQRQAYDGWMRSLPVHEQMRIQHRLVGAASARDTAGIVAGALRNGGTQSGTRGGTGSSGGTGTIATRHIVPPALTLPDGDLLEAVHAYAADFYTARPRGMPLMKQIMDGTALFALGVLLEEVAAESLGTNGHLALLEDEALDAGMGRRWYNGVRDVPFVTTEEIEAQSRRRPEFEASEGSLLKELLS